MVWAVKIGMYLVYAQPGCIFKDSYLGKYVTIYTNNDNTKLYIRQYAPI